ncbi:MAG: M56 family metallopeptidase [Lachnospiraceae bacterium]|nr:M56 family metallopeptidase [Lachnospiraceae bacterium]
MNEIMKILVSLSVSGTLLLLLLLGLKQFYKNKFSRRWQYYIWVIVALRFLLTFTFTDDTTVVGSLFEKFGAAEVTDGIPAGRDGSVSESESITENTAATETELIEKGRNIDAAKAEPIEDDRGIIAGGKVKMIEKGGNIASARSSFHLSACLFFAWLVPALILLVYKIMVYQRFIRRVKADNIEVSDTGIRSLLSDCEEKLNIQTNVGLFRNPLIASPMLIGFFHPSILLPEGELGEKELSYIFMHELIHCRRKDMFYKWLIQIVVCVHWFNPFVYLLEKEVNQSCELSCDERVISMLDDRARREYGDMLISFLKADNPCKNSLASVTLSEGAKQIKERLGAIMDFRSRTRIIQALTGLLTLCVLFGAAFLGSYTVAGAEDASPMGIGSSGAGKLQAPRDLGMPAKLCESCGKTAQRAVRIQTYETGPEVRECVHGYPYGEDLVFKEYIMYQYQCTACFYKGEFGDFYSGDIAECHGYYPGK